MSTVLNLPCTLVPPTDKNPTRELPYPHLAFTADSQEGIKLGRYIEIRKDDKTYASQEDPRMQPIGATLHESHESHTTEGASELQGSRVHYPDQKRKNYGTRGKRTVASGEQHRHQRKEEGGPGCYTTRREGNLSP